MSASLFMFVVQCINMHTVSISMNLIFSYTRLLYPTPGQSFFDENMDESFDIGDAERMQIEEIAQVANLDAITSCSCRGMCLREKGRNSCPCKTIGQYCSSACHDLSSACMNRRQYIESDSDSSEQEEESEFEGGESNQSIETVETRSRGRSATRGRARRAGRANSNRGRGRGRGRERGRGRGRGQGGLVEEDDSQQRIMAHDQQLQDLVAQLDDAAVRRLALELLRRQPAAFADLVDGEFANLNERPDPEEPDPEQPQDSPDWCFCGNCAPMPTQEENKCCCRRAMPCITSSPLFAQLVLNGNVLDIAMRYREDIIVAAPVRNNENFRHAAYRQFVLWQHGRLGRGNRVVVPSCCVLKIRARYPSPNGLYVGFRPARL